MLYLNTTLTIVHFDKILSPEISGRVNFTIKMSEIYIENKEFCFKLVLDTIFRTSKSLEQTINYYL